LPKATPVDPSRSSTAAMFGAHNRGMGPLSRGYIDDTGHSLIPPFPTGLVAVPPPARPMRNEWDYDDMPPLVRCIRIHPVGSGLALPCLALPRLVLPGFLLCVCLQTRDWCVCLSLLFPPRLRLQVPASHLYDSSSDSDEGLPPPLFFSFSRCRIRIIS
jgi:hypothetical protein